MRSLRSIVPLLVFLGGAPHLAAQDYDEPRLTTDFGYASRYVFRGVERAGHSARASVEYAANGFRGSVWANRPLRGGVGGEVDLTAAYARQLTEKLNVELALTAFRFTNVSPGATEHSVEAALTASWAPLNGFVPSISLRRDFRLNADTVDAAVSYSLPLPKLGAFLECSIFAGWTDAKDVRPDSAGPRLRDGYGFGGAEIHLPYRVSTRATVIAGLHATTTVNQGAAFSAPGRPARANLWVTFGVSSDF